MSCQMNSFGVIADFESTKKSLHIKGWTNERSLLSSLQQQDTKDCNWLEECGFSLSPTGEVLALTFHQNLVILMSKWDSNEESTAKMKYYMVWHGDPCQGQNEVITAVCVLPLAAPQTQRTSHLTPDWTCIALGFSSGALRFFTEKGDLLLSEVLQEDPVLSIKCQTASATRHSNLPELTEELHVCYHGVVCSIYGFVLTNTLRACRNQLARVQANCSASIVAPPLSMHKWSLPDQDNVADCAVGLPQCPSAFSHLQIASVCGGFGTSYRPSPPQSSLVVAVGNKPFVGFNYIVEGTSGPVLTDMVKAVGTKIRSAINQSVPNWLWSAKKSHPVPEKEKVVIEPAEPMTFRFGLCDLWRQGNNITMSPQHNLCVITDSLGRVTLIDNSSGLALRMWKGYRDAQCGWLTAEEQQETKSHKRSALFLVIYAPKKGIVEVWAMQQGPRVATFTVSKNGRLVYIGHGQLGVSTLVSKKPNRSVAPCVFVDEFGTIADISVPFHCALRDKNSARARDLHLVRKLHQLLKDGTGDSIVELSSQLRTCEMRAQGLDILTSSRRTTPQTMLDVVESFLHTLQVQPPSDENVKDSNRKSLLQRCLKLQKLLIFFLFCSGLGQKPPDYETVVKSDANQDLDELSELLRISRDETLYLLQSSNEKKETVRVKFQEGPEGLASFLAGFQTDSGSENLIQLVEPSSNQNLVHISEVVFGGVAGNVSAWTSAAADSCINSLALLRLAVVGWLSRRTVPSVSDTLNFGQLIMAVCTIAGERVQEGEWWEEVRRMLKESTQPQLAVTAAVVCKAVALTVEENAVMTTSAGTDDSEASRDWEKVTQDTCTWSLLISQLEDVALISAVLRNKPECSKTPVLNCLPYDPPELSLQNVCSKGRGCVSELVARWVASCGLEPSLVLEPKEQSPHSVSIGKTGSGLGVVEGERMDAERGEEAHPVSSTDTYVLARLRQLRRHFPYSLGERPLMANQAWEYVLAWSRKVDCLSSLQSGVACLKALPCPHLTQGVCILLWTMHLKSMFESTLRLINKIGKVPKERLCRQEIGLSEHQIADFFTICSDFFDVFLESRAMSEHCTKEPVSHEATWESSAVPPLHQLALNQTPANYDLLLLLSQCSRAFQLLSIFSLRTHHPLNALFDPIGQSALFAVVTGHIQLPYHVVDSTLTESRTLFLLRAVTTAVSTITLHDGEYNMVSAVEWMKHCLLLAADWSISADPLRRRQCCELYSRGLDRLAEEVIVSVSDTAALGSELLLVAGHRVQMSMSQSKTQLKEQMTHMSPIVSSWISSLGEPRVDPASMADTLELVIVASSLLDEHTEQKNIAMKLLDSLTPIVDKDRTSSR